MLRGLLAPLLVACLLVACKQEPSFDERYDAAEETIHRKASEIDSELRATEPAAERAGEPAVERTTPTPSPSPSPSPGSDARG